MPPYQKFGKALHALRQQFHVSRQEFCGALEINDTYLEKLETGFERPSEEIIEQVISHFSLDGVIADNLWLFAGYPVERIEDMSVNTIHVPMSELKISYTDLVHVSVNNFGVVLNFMQNQGPNNQPVVVSRLGMSKEHAKSLVHLINTTIHESTKQKKPKTQKALPPKTEC